MDHLQIPVDTNDARWRQRFNERMDRLKNIQSITEDSPLEPGEELSGEKKLRISCELYQSVESKSLDRFIDVLEKSVSPERNRSLSVIFDQVTAAELLTKRNMMGDTPLHVAARANSFKVIELILSRDKALTKEKNEFENTALHEAVYANHYDSVSHLFRADLERGPEVCHPNKSGESLLYTAVFCSNRKILDLLLEAASEKPSVESHGTSPLHGVIFKRDIDLLAEILEKKPELMDLRDEDGGTPLHWAASTNYLDGVRVLLNKSTLFAEEQDAKGNFPIHLACRESHVNVVKEFIKKGCPNIRDLHNQEGQNILHVAANNGNDKVVGYLLRNAGLEKFTINGKDKQGNTPLHLASEKSYPKVLFHLTKDKRINVNLKNNNNFTAYDLLLESMRLPISFQEYLSEEILLQAGAELSVKEIHLFETRKATLKPQLNVIKDQINTVMLMAILIATVTFAAGFTVPGSVYSSDENDPQKRGLAVLANKTSFQMFIICNTIAMYSSTTGCIILLWGSFPDFYVAAQSELYGLYMVGLALITMSLAFMAAIRLVVNNVLWLANLITVIATIFFILCLVMFILLLFPMDRREPGLRQISNFVIAVYLWFHESHDLNRDKVKQENSDKDRK